MPLSRVAAITCRADEPNDAVRVLNPAPSYAFGEQVVYRCEDGYVLDGPRARRCESPAGSGQGRLGGFNPVCRGESEGRGG